MKTYRKTDAYKRVHVYNKEYNRAYKEKNKVNIKMYNDKNKDVVKKRVMLAKYGVTTDEYNLMFKRQDGKCAICGKHQTEITRSLCVDHCHETGKVRGLLCSKCNSSIGFMEDDIENLKCAVLYLNKSSQPL